MNHFFLQILLTTYLIVTLVHYNHFLQLWLDLQKKHNQFMFNISVKAEVSRLEKRAAWKFE